MIRQTAQLGWLQAFLTIRITGPRITYYHLCTFCKIHPRIVSNITHYHLAMFCFFKKISPKSLCLYLVHLLLCFNLVYVISVALSQSHHIKRLPMYINWGNTVNLFYVIVFEKFLVHSINISCRQKFIMKGQYP